MWKKWLLPALLTLLIVGCADKQKQKNAAIAQWQETRAKVLLGLAKDQYKNGNFDQSRATVNDGMKLAPKNVDLRVLSAKLAIEQGQLELADQELTKARELDPKNAEIDYLSGVIQQRWQKPEKAYEYYSAAVEKQPSELAYVMAKSETLVGMGREAEALKMLEEKVVFFEHSPVIRDAVGQLLMRKSQYKEGAEMLRQASILATDDLSIREHLSLALYLAGEYRDALEQLTRLTANEQYQNRAELWVTLGECQMQLGEARKARLSFDHATQIDSNLASAWLSLGRAALEMNDQRRAELATKKVLALEADNIQGHLLMGYIRMRQGKNPEALASFRKATALDPKDTVSLCMVGYTLEKMGKSEQAVRYYAQALKIKPNDEMASKLMASVEVKE